MQFSAVLNMLIMKTYLNSIFTKDLKRKDNFSKNVHCYRPSLFNSLPHRYVLQRFFAYRADTDQAALVRAA